MSQERLFPEDGAKELDSKAIKSLIGDGELYMAVLAMNNKEYESALMSFEKVERPYASYYTAQVVKIIPVKFCTSSTFSSTKAVFLSGNETKTNFIVPLYMQASWSCADFLYILKISRNVF